MTLGRFVERRIVSRPLGSGRGAVCRGGVTVEATGRGVDTYKAPFVFFGVVWVAAVGLLAARGLWTWVGRGAGEAAGLGLFIGLTLLLTRGRPPLPEEEEPERDHGSGRLVLQLAVALALAALSSLRSRPIPLWSPFVGWLYRIGSALPVPHPNYLVNPVLYVLVPGALVLALGAGWREIGFGRGWRPWRVIAVWSAPVAGFWVYALVGGSAGVGRIVRLLISNTFQNGFSEEFLWRGLVQTRIARLWTPGWGLVLASLAFGWWHIDSVTDWAGTDLWVAGALNVIVQAPMGLALGVIFDRTRNLLAPSVVHAVVNAVDL